MEICYVLTLFSVGLLYCCTRVGGGEQKGPLPKICHLYPKRSKKYMNPVTHSLSSADIGNFSAIFLYQEIQI